VYLAKHTGRQLKAKATRFRFRIDVNTLSEHAANKLEMNEIASVDFETSQSLFFDPYSSNRTTGSFILIDPLTNATVGAGMIRETLPPGRARQRLVEEHPDHGKSGKVTVEERIERRGHRPAIFTLVGERRRVEALERTLLERGFEVVLVDHYEVPPSGRRTFFSTLWNLGVLILSWREKQVRPRDHGLFKALARESYFDLSDVDSSKDSEQAFDRVLGIAETLRSKPFANGLKED